jgi:hypothetical protein
MICPTQGWLNKDTICVVVCNFVALPTYIAVAAIYISISAFSSLNIYLIVYGFTSAFKIKLKVSRRFKLNWFIMYKRGEHEL